MRVSFEPFDPAPFNETSFIVIAEPLLQHRFKTRLRALIGMRKLNILVLILNF